MDMMPFLLIIFRTPDSFCGPDMYKLLGTKSSQC